MRAVLLPHCGELSGAGVQCRGRLQRGGGDCSVPKQVDPISFKNSQVCARGGARAAWAPGRAGSLAPCHPLNYASRTPAPLAGTEPPGPHGDTRPRSKRVGTTPGQQGRCWGVSLQAGCPPGLAQLRESPGSVPER